MGRPREYTTGGKRFYVIDVRGYPITPEAMTRNSGGTESAAYAVLDRDNMHLEVGIFVPETGGRNSGWCRRRAEALAQTLNAEVGA